MLITLLTDFGEKDPYVGVMKGVIFGLNPTAQVVDLTHQVTPQAIREGAFLLQNAFSFFPPDTIHVAVVDPGVGTDRKGICIQVPGVGYFIGPDNGLFSYILDSFPNPAVREITNPRFLRPEVSATFHGRDVFAPVAAHLSLGEDWEEIGPPLENWLLNRLPNLWPAWSEAPDSLNMQGEIIHVDHFGSLVTNIPKSAFEGMSGDKLEIAQILFAMQFQVRGIVRTYGEAQKGQLVTLFGSSGFLEIARVNGRADELRGTNESSPNWLGQKVLVRIRT